MKHNTIAAERLRAILDYDPCTGVFRRADNGIPTGTVNGTGYVVIRIDGKSYRAHRLAWLYVHGQHPTKDIDHVDRDKTNNRIANLREASESENLWNASLSKRNTSGVKGVSFNTKRQKYVATIGILGKLFFLGYFDTANEAANMRQGAASLFHGDFCHHASSAVVTK